MTHKQDTVGRSDPSIRRALREAGSVHRGVRIIVAAWIGSILCAGGCVRSGGLSRGEPAEGVDRQKAYLTLSEVPPSFSLPTLSLPRALSSRATESLVRADDLSKQQRYTEALLELERGLRYDPKHPALLERQAILHDLAGNSERACTSARQALEGDAGLASMHGILGRAALKQGRLAEGVEHLRLAVLLAVHRGERPAASDRHLLAGALNQLGYLTAALEQYDALTEDAGPDAEALLREDDVGVSGRAAEILERLGRPDEALKRLETTAKRGTATSAERERHVRLLLKAGRSEEARRLASGLSLADPGTLPLLEEVYEKLGQPEGMVADLRNRLAGDPTDVAAATALVEICARRGRIETCFEVLREFVLRVPEGRGVRDRLISALLTARRYEESVELCSAAAERDSSLLGLLSGAFESLDAAGVEGVLATRPKLRSAEASYFRAVAALTGGRPAAARAELAEHPGFVEAHAAARRVIGRAALSEYRWTEAREAAKRRNPDVAEDGGLERISAEAALGLDDLAAAELHFKAALQLDRRDEQALLGLARIYARTDRRLQYEQQLQAVLEVNALNVEARELLTLEYLRTGRIDEVARQLKEFDAIAPASSALARCVAEVQRRQQGDLEGFRKILEQAVERNGPDARTLVLLGDASAVAEDYAGARARYEQALSLDGANEEAFLRLVGLDALELAFERALERMQPWLERYPNRHAWRLERVQALTVVQRFEDALSSAEAEEARADLDPLTRGAYRERILELLGLLHRDEERLRRLEGWASGETDGGPWTRRLIEEHLSADRAKEASELARRVFEATGDRLIGEMYVNALAAGGASDAALRIVLDWLEEDPASDTYAIVLAGKLNLVGRPEDALEVLRNLLEVTAERDLVRERISSVLRRAERHDEYIRFVESWIDEVTQAAREAEGRPGARLERIEAVVSARLHELQVMIVQELLLAKRYSDAVARVQLLLEGTLDAGRQGELLMLAYQGYHFAGREAEALEALERCYAMQPLDAGINNDLGYLLAERGERLEQALKMTRFAVAQSPRNPAYLDSYGWALYKSGDFEGAYTWILRSTRAERRDDEVVLDHLGDAAWRTGRKEEAVQAWNRAAAAADRALADAPDDADARKVRELAAAKAQAAGAGSEPKVADVAAPERRRA